MANKPSENKKQEQQQEQEQEQEQEQDVSEQEQLDSLAEEEQQDKSKSSVTSDKTIEQLLPSPSNRQDYSTYFLYVYRSSLLVSFLGNNGARITLNRTSLITLSTEIRSRTIALDFKREAQKASNLKSSDERFNFGFQSDRRSYLSDALSRSIKNSAPLRDISLKYSRINLSSGTILFFQLNYDVKERGSSVEYGLLKDSYGVYISIEQFKEIMSHLEVPSRAEVIETLGEEIPDDV